jgi:pyruvate kinase
MQSQSTAITVATQKTFSAHVCRRQGDLIRGRAATLPVVSSKDWQDIDWAIQMKVDFLAVSFVRTADVIQNLRWVWLL